MLHLTIILASTWCLITRYVPVDALYECLAIILTFSLFLSPSLPLQPDDVLFMLHHANVDRIWALWQDYHGHDEVAAFDSTHYSHSNIDTRMIFNGASNVDFNLPGDLQPPTPRAMLLSYGGVVDVTYANDHLGMLLAQTTEGKTNDYLVSNNPNWIQRSTGPVDEKCGAATFTAQPTAAPVVAPTSTPAPVGDCALGQNRDPCNKNSACCSGNCKSGSCKGHGRNLKKKKNKSRSRSRSRSQADKRSRRIIIDPPDFANPKARERWAELSWKLPAGEILKILAEEDCLARGLPQSASQAWIDMNNMTNSPRVFDCHF
jgi:hypothetical protein